MPLMAELQRLKPRPDLRIHAHPFTSWGFSSVDLLPQRGVEMHYFEPDGRFIMDEGTSLAPSPYRLVYAKSPDSENTNGLPNLQQIQSYDSFEVS